MAWDHGLAEALQPGTAVLRFYDWSPPTISLGRNQTARDRYDLDEAAALGVDFVRRPTGGSAVMHHREITYSVVVPLRALGGPRATFTAISEGLLAGVREGGAPAELELQAGRTPGPPSAERLCFGVRAPGELSVGGRKLLGSAQARIGEALLQHGSLLISDPQEGLARITRDGRFQGPPPTTMQAALGGAVDSAEIRKLLLASLQRRLGGTWERAEPTTAEREAARRLEAHYRSPEWTWRR